MPAESVVVVSSWRDRPIGQSGVRSVVCASFTKSVGWPAPALAASRFGFGSTTWQLISLIARLPMTKITPVAADELPADVAAMNAAARSGAGARRDRVRR